MSGDTHFDPTGEKKARKKATFGGAVVCGVFNVVLGVLLGFVVLSLTAPVEYKPKADAKTGKTPPPPAGLYYWAGPPSGDYHAKEAQLLSASPSTVSITDGELNAWSAVTFKSTQPPKVAATPKPAAKPADPKATGEDKSAKAKEEMKALESDLQSFGVAAGSPNFHVFKDAKAPADAPVSLQIALPMTVTIFGVAIDTVYQARGVFVAGAQGPEFKPYMSYFGSARIPGPFAGKMFNSFIAKFAAADAAKKYADAWAKLASASITEEGALVLASK
jgi:hypothetical protein